MSWNYRIMKYEDGSLGIHEVFYDEEGDVQGWTENAVSVYGEDIHELESSYDLMMQAFSKPILEYNDE